MDELISDFIAETTDSIAELDTEIIRLEQNPDDSDLVGSIFRLMHTIKGTCGFLGLSRLASVAHAAENVLDKIRDGEMTVTQETVTITLEAMDRIKELIEHLESEGQEPDGDDSDLIGRLNAMASGSITPPTQESSPSEADDEPELTEEEILQAMMTDEESEDADAATPVSDDTASDDNAIQSGEVSLEELERIFNETACEIDYSVEDGKQALQEEWANNPPIDEVDADVSPSNEAGQDVVPADTAESDKESITSDTPALSPKAKEKAIQEGLATKVQDPAEKTRSTGGVAAQNIRVRLDLLENLMQLVSELVLTRNQLMQILRGENDSIFASPLQRLSHITTELQDGVMKTRMQPISTAWAKFPRLIRDLSMELNKKIALHMEGEETELDRQLLDIVKDPLTHMVRNSCDHGIELPEDRRSSGKDEEGNVTLRAYHEGGHIIIEIQDDGRGVNLERVKEKALENGMASESEIEAMSDQQILQFIFRPGFSTAAAVTSVSGRGVGMDVVVSNIEKIGGTVEIFSTAGQGSTFQIKIPLTLAIVSVLIVEVSGEKFAIPQINVLEMLQTSNDSEHKIEYLNDAPILRLRGKLLPLLTLSTILSLDAPGHSRNHFIVICKIGGYEFGVIVDRIFDTEEIVVKPISPLLQHIELYSGCTILGDGSVILILDPNGLAKRTGDPIAQQDEEVSSRSQRLSQKMTSFLLFSTGDITPKAVPLELISRLEEIEGSRVEHSSHYPVIQYRDRLMRLFSLEGTPEFNPESIYQVIVFTYEGLTLGMVVEDILDIADIPLEVKLSSEDDRLLGSMVIHERTTDIVDIGHFFTQMIGSMPERNGADSDKIVERPLILLVEDSAFHRNLIGPFLSSAGYDVITAEHGKAGLKALMENPDFGLIVSDIEMPEMDGFEFAQACQNNPAYKHIPMIAFTSKITEKAIARGNAAGFTDYISKTDREGLLLSIQTHLDTESKSQEEVA